MAVKRAVASVNAPWLVINGETCVVTRQWLTENVGSKRAFKIATATYEWLTSYDDADFVKWYEAGLLTATDRLQDVAVVGRLTHGLRILNAMFPRACARAKMEVLSNLS